MDLRTVMPSSVGSEHSMSVASRRWMMSYVIVLVVGFAVLFLLTRSSVPVGDSRHYIETARAGDPAAFHYGNPSHFLQIPLSRAIWRSFGALGMPVSLENIVLALALFGTLAAIVFMGLIAAEMTRTSSVAWLAAILFGTSLHVWTQVNGEQYGLPLGFVTAGIWLALRGRIVAPAIFWALATISHSEFFMAGPAFVMAAWFTRPGPMSTGAKLRTISGLLGLAGGLVLLNLLFWSWVLGKWSTPASLVAWVQYIYYVDHQYTVGRPEIFRAMKGLVTALTVAGHFWRDILTGRGVTDAAFVLKSAVGLLVLAVIAVSLAAATRQRRLFLFGLAWLLPFHVLGNWWFVPTVEKYHAGALPGFVLLVTGGLVQISSGRFGPWRYLIWAGFLGTCAALNLFGALLPMQVLGRDRIVAERGIRQLNEASAGRAVFVTCDAPAAVVLAGVKYYRLRSFWTGTIPEIQAKVLAWTRARVEEGYQPYLVGRWCYPEEWLTTWSKARFDLYFLDQSFDMAPTAVTNMPIGEDVATDPLSWVRGDVVRLDPRSGLR